jgi:hypothetical protein
MPVSLCHRHEYIEHARFDTLSLETSGNGRVPVAAVRYCVRPFELRPVTTALAADPAEQRRLMSMLGAWSRDLFWRHYHISLTATNSV